MQFMLNRKDLFICVTNCTYMSDVIYPEHVIRHTLKFINLVDACASCASTCGCPYVNWTSRHALAQLSLIGNSLLQQRICKTRTLVTTDKQHISYAYLFI